MKYKCTREIQNLWMLILRYIQLQIMHYINNIAQARTILHASVGQVQYGPSAGNIFWYPPNIKAMQYNYYYS